MSDTNTFYLKVGDTYPNIETILKNGDGNPIDLTGATVRFRMSVAGGGNLMLEEDATLVTPQTGTDIGRVYYTWDTDDVAIAGTYQAEWIVTFSSGKIATFPRGVTNGTDFNLVVIEPVVN